MREIMRHGALFLLCYLFFFVPYAQAQYLDISGQWKFVADIDPDNFIPEDAPWTKIKVPSNWYSEGHDFHGWGVYKQTFSLPDSWENNRVHLIFNGVDYEAKIVLNDQEIGTHIGYFQPFGFDVSHALHENGQENTLLVYVNAPLEDEDGVLGKDWSLHKKQIKGVLNHHDTRPGGAWGTGGQDQSTGGIWAPVTLKKSRCLGILHQRITPLKNRVQIDLQIGSDSWKNVSVDTRIVPANFKGKTYHHRQNLRVKPGYNETTLKIVTPEPELWWPYELGKANLYYAQTVISVDNRQQRLLPGSREGLPFNGACRDTSKVRFGYRFVEWSDQEKGWLINGQRLFQRGTNYIAGIHLADLTQKDFKRDITLMKEAHINAVRVHAHVTHPQFYEHADEEGMMIWQDFPLQWGYEDTLEFQAEALKQVRDMVHGFYNYPSIIAWQIHNEPPWDAWWMEHKYKSYEEDQNKILDKVLHTRVKSLDKTRLIHKASTNDEHPWYGWYSKHFEDYHKPVKEKLVSEFGAQGLPSEKILKEFLKKSQLWPLNKKNLKAWEYHNFQPRETFEIAKIKKGKNLKAFIKNSQTYQANSIKAGAEGLRLQRYSPVAGAFQFMFNEHWESVNWGVMDYKRNPKKAYTALQSAFQPTVPVVSPYLYEGMKNVPETISIHLINDQIKDFESVSLDIALKNGGKTLWYETLEQPLKADSMAHVMSLNLQGLKAGHYELALRLEDSKGALMSKNAYGFEVDIERE